MYTLMAKNYLLKLSCCVFLKIIIIEVKLSVIAVDYDE